MSNAWTYARQQGKDEWLTPPEIIHALGEFDLDPCAPITRPWPTAKQHFTKEDDGLSCEWFGRVWLNPPYGTQTHRWLKKLAEYGNGIALIFARTETRMFFDYVWPVASALLFIQGRLTFYSSNGVPGAQNSGSPSVLVAYNGSNATALAKSGIKGVYCPRYGTDSATAIYRAVYYEVADGVPPSDPKVETI